MSYDKSLMASLQRMPKEWVEKMSDKIQTHEELEQEIRKHEYERLQYTYMLSRINERMKK